MTQRKDFQTENEPQLARDPRTDAGKAASERLAIRTAIARAIIDARIAKKWTQQQLADAAGTKQSRISDLEGARGNPTIETIERVARALGLELMLQRHPDPDPGVTVHKSKSLIGQVIIVGSFGPERYYQPESDRFEEVPIPEPLLHRMRGASRGRIA